MKVKIHDTGCRKQHLRSVVRTSPTCRCVRGLEESRSAAASLPPFLPLRAGCSFLQRPHGRWRVLVESVRPAFGGRETVWCEVCRQARDGRGSGRQGMAPMAADGGRPSRGLLVGACRALEGTRRISAPDARLSWSGVQQLLLAVGQRTPCKPLGYTAASQLQQTRLSAPAALPHCSARFLHTPPCGKTARA